jgi:hypothetical protein
LVKPFFHPHEDRRFLDGFLDRLLAPVLREPAERLRGQPAAYVVGANYGQPSCPDQFLLEMDLSASNSAGSNVFVSGGWSVVTPATPCGYNATITIWGYDGSTWTKFDQLVTQGQSEPIGDGGSGCHHVVTSREIQTTLGGTWIPAGTFMTARVAAVASDCGQKLPVDIFAEE